MPPAKIRADELLVLQGKAPTRTLAKALIMAGKVRAGPHTLIAKPATALPPDTPLHIETPPRYVSRGGEKLAHALAHFHIDPTRLHALDIGASTGGFTDCLLQHGATHIDCVDVGHGQLHPKLRANPRVTNLEKINARTLATHPLPRPDYALIVMDLAFISLTKTLAPAWARLTPGGHLIALIKPQFEAQKTEADKTSGIIRDPAIHTRIVEEIRTFAQTRLPRVELLGTTPSPIQGGDGNREFLIALHRRTTSP
ncbi:MAG: TlyA family RNA methyltransferase [Puniceicoccales bacterium]|jgi:23S rRNA (cytidine1920-2'-O)/16S rRNA (cytidine1409-2'-O)-methyltransferase|nr:TlyA family RNA methyltransferase [Puniceicoccales bacterium]